MTEMQREIPGILSGLWATARRDLLLAWKRPGDVLNPLFFFAMVCTLFPLAVGPSAEQLEFSGPGVLWVAALLATLLSLNSLFLSDYEDGSLDQLLVSPQPLPVLALGKTLAHWLWPAARVRLPDPGHHLPHAWKCRRGDDVVAGPRHGQPEPARLDRRSPDCRPASGNRAAKPVNIAAGHAGIAAGSERGIPGRQQ